MEKINVDELIECLRRLSSTNLHHLDLRGRDLNGLNFSGMFASTAFFNEANLKQCMFIKSQLGTFFARISAARTSQKQSSMEPVSE